MDNSSPIISSLGMACVLVASACAADVTEPRPAEDVVTASEALSDPGNSSAVWWSTPSTQIGQAITPLANFSTRVQTVTRTAVGEYQVALVGGLGPAAAVVAYGSDSTRCKIKSTTGGALDTQKVNVICHHPNATPADSRFVMFAMSTLDRSVEGRAGVGTITAAGQITVAHNFLTASFTDTVVVKSGPGNYNVKLKNLGAALGSVQITARGNDATHCKVGGWGALLTGEQQINVRCFLSGANNPADSGFDFIYDEGIVSPNGVGAHAWANLATQEQYHPDTRFVFNTTAFVNGSNQVALATLIRGSNGLETGHYSMTYKGFNRGDHSYATVGAYGTGSEYCKIELWSCDSSTAVCDINVRTRCFDRNGAAVNTLYVQTFGSFDPLQSI